MTLNFSIQRQILDEWCWAAVASSISLYYDRNSIWTQSRLAGDLLNDNCGFINESNADNAPQICHDGYDLLKALSHTNNNAWLVERTLSLDEITNQLENEWPICCQIYWKEFDKAHVVTIFGIEGSKLVIGDPEDGVCSLRYNDFIDNYRTGIWVRTYGTQA